MEQQLYYPLVPVTVAFNLYQKLNYINKPSYFMDLSCDGRFQKKMVEILI